MWSGGGGGKGRLGVKGLGERRFMTRFLLFYLFGVSPFYFLKSKGLNPFFPSTLGVWFGLRHSAAKSMLVTKTRQKYPAKSKYVCLKNDPLVTG